MKSVFNLRSFKHGLIAGLGFFILAWGGIELTREAGGTSSIWPATGLALAFFLRTPRNEWTVLSIATLAGSVFAHVAHQDAWGRTLVTSPLGVGQALLCAHLLRKYTNEEFDLRQYQHLMKFAVVALLSPIAFTLAAAGFFTTAYDMNFINVGMRWYLADSLGLIIFTPLFFILGWDQLKNFTAQEVRYKSVILMTALAAVLSLVFMQSSYPLLFLIFPIMALSAFWLGTCGAIVALTATTAVSIICTMNGTGPIILIQGSLSEKTLVLQGFLATAALISLPIASALNYRTQLEREAREARDLANKANLAKSQFLTSMSHEFRTPLNAILGFSQLVLMDQNLNEKSKEHLNFIMAGGEHLLKLVADVMDLAKIEAGIISTKEEIISCADILDEVIELVRPLAEKRQINIDKFYPSYLYVTADRSRLLQVMVNLLSNAIKYNRVGGHVAVTAARLDGDIRFKVTDSGIGIALDQQDNVFEPFNRLGAEASDIEGTGIGLAISKQLTEAMNGKIGFKSIEAYGSSFYVDLPAAVHDEIDEQAVGKTVEISGGARSATRILYIEDNKANAELMRSIARTVLKADIMVATSGKAGLRQAREFSPDLIISDIHLSDMTGHEVLKSLKDHPVTAKIPVMGLTADATYLKTDKANDFDRIMSKPFQIKELVENLEGMLKAAA